MVSRKVFLRWWVGGLIAFAIVIAIGLPLMVDGVPGGIADHQRAGGAHTVNQIHTAWKAAGVMGTARTAIMADFVFIAIYGLGSVLGGLYLRQTERGILRHLGTLVALCGVIFLAADYGETTAQFIQLVRDKGDDGLAGLAARMRPIKTAAWLATFLGISASLAVRRFQRAAS